MTTTGATKVAHYRSLVGRNFGFAVISAALVLGAAAHSQETAAAHHERGVAYHLQRRLDEASREYAQALAVDPPRAPSEDQRALVLRFAPRVYVTPDESFPLKDAAAIVHPVEPLIAYHFFWEDDIDFPDDNDPCDHEVMWVQYSRDRPSIERVWTYFHGRILEGGRQAVQDAVRHEMRPRVNVQWGKHGSMPLGWESMTIVADTGDSERAYYPIGKPISLTDYNQGTWQKLRKEGRRLIDHPMARRLKWPDRFTGDWNRFVDFSRPVDLVNALANRNLMAVSRWNSAVINQHFLPYNFRPKTEWPHELPTGVRAPEPSLSR
jgi:hypothetical protein